MKSLIREIHENAMKCATAYKRNEAALLIAIQQVDVHRAYFEFDCGSLFDYVTSVLGLSEASAFNFIVVSRKALDIPEIVREIESGNLTVSKARKVVPVINTGNYREWLDKAATLTQRQLEAEVAKIAPREARPEQVSVLSESVRELRIPVSVSVYEDFRRAQAIAKAATLEETLKRVLEFFLQKKDPVLKAEKLIEKVDSPVLRQPRARNLVNYRDRGRCTFVNARGNRCGRQRYVEIHHVLPKSAGGSDSAENLVTLCSAHHKLTHRIGP